MAARCVRAGAAAASLPCRSALEEDDDDRVDRVGLGGVLADLRKLGVRFAVPSDATPLQASQGPMPRASAAGPSSSRSHPYRRPAKTDHEQQSRLGTLFAYAAAPLKWGASLFLSAEATADEAEEDEGAPAQPLRAQELRPWCRALSGLAGIALSEPQGYPSSEPRLPCPLRSSRFRPCWVAAGRSGCAAGRTHSDARRPQLCDFSATEFGGDAGAALRS